MDNAEYTAWSTYMKSRKGLWSIDPVHNGEDRDLIAFCPDRNDHSKGVCVMIDGPTIESGRYEDAYTHMGDASFQIMHGFSVMDGTRPNHGCAKPSDEAMKLVMERLGVRFLLETICM